MYLSLAVSNLFLEHSQLIVMLMLSLPGVTIRDPGILRSRLIMGAGSFLSTFFFFLITLPSSTISRFFPQDLSLSFCQANIRKSLWKQNNKRKQGKTDMSVNLGKFMKVSTTFPKCNKLDLERGQCLKCSDFVDFAIFAIKSTFISNLSAFISSQYESRA